jgi:iron complex outermembrane receptor protein
MYRSHSARPSKLKSAVLAILSASAIHIAHADETPLQEVFVTASLGKNLLDVASPTTVLAGDDLMRQLNGSLGETLSRQLGVSSSYFGPAASRPVIRGLGGYRVQTLQDGLSTLDVGNLSDDHATTVDPALAEQLEVLKGPATLLYGSGASGGLINVVTDRIPSHAPQSGVDGIAELRGGTVADERAGVLSLNAGGQHFAVHADAFKSESKDIDIPSEPISARLRTQIEAEGGEVEAQEHRIKNAFTDTQGGSLGAAWLGANTTIGANVSRYESEYGLPTEEEAYIDMEQDRYQAKAEWRSESGWLRGVQLSGAYNDYTHTEFEEPGNPGTVFTQEAFDVRLAANRVHNDIWRGTFGVQVTRVDFVAEGEEAFVPPSVTESVGVFALEEFDVQQWTLSLGARYEQQSAEASSEDEPLPKFDDSAVSFAGGAVLKLSDIDTLSFSLTHSARHPQATELFAYGPHLAAQRFEIGDATLDTEKANTLDISLRRHADGFSWLVNVFYNDYSNFVFASPTGDIEDDFPVVQYMQSAATLFGYEAELWAPLYSRNEQSLRLRLMSDYVRGEREGGEPLPQMPPLRFGVGLHFDQAAWHAAVEGIHHAEQDRLASNELATDSYLMLNADVSYRLEAAGEWFLFLRGSNLLDNEARQHTSSLKDLVPLPGRSFTAGVRLTF